MKKSWLVFGCFFSLACGSQNDFDKAARFVRPLPVTGANPVEFKLVDGRPANPGEYPQVVYIRIFATGSDHSAWCTATLVGNNVILTASHCADDGRENAVFKINNKEYTAKLTQSPWYSPSGVPTFHDVALGLLTRSVSDVPPMNVGGETLEGKKLVLAGYGCTNSDGTGGNDGVLRVGENTVLTFDKWEMAFSRQTGAVTCFGDSGGPSFVVVDGRTRQLGVHSSGDYQSVFDIRTDIPKTRQFFSEWASENNVDICGVTRDCP